MKNKKLFAAIGGIDDKFIAEEAEQMPMTQQNNYHPKHFSNPIFRRFAIAAVLVVTMLSATAFAIYQFTLKDLETQISQTGAKEIRTLSLNGLKNSPEYEAAREWETYVSACYEKGENMPAPDLVPDEYFQYNAFSREAKDTLDAILNKYNLKMHNMPGFAKTFDELYSALGISGFMPASGGSGEFPVGGSYYDDGTFNFNCTAVLSKNIELTYQFYHFVKGSFTRVGYIFGDTADFEEWTYTTPDGTEVLLAISANKSIMAVNFDKSFVFINILSGTENSDENRTSYGLRPLEKSDLEAFANSFDFAALNAVAR
jgi:hypothetical protein